jgi:hypothetical protein
MPGGLMDFMSCWTRRSVRIQGAFGTRFPTVYYRACGENVMLRLLRDVKKSHELTSTFFSTLLEWVNAVGLLSGSLLDLIDNFSFAM